MTSLRPRPSKSKIHNQKLCMALAFRHYQRVPLQHPHSSQRNCEKLKEESITKTEEYINAVILRLYWLICSPLEVVIVGSGISGYFVLLLNVITYVIFASGIYKLPYLVQSNRDLYVNSKPTVCRFLTFYSNNHLFTRRSQRPRRRRRRKIQGIKNAEVSKTRVYKADDVQRLPRWTQACHQIRLSCYHRWSPVLPVLPSRRPETSWTKY